MYLRKELHRVTGDDVDQSHPQLVASFMTVSGSVKSMSRYTMRTQSGTWSRAAFKEPVDILLWMFICDNMWNNVTDWD